MTTTPPVCIVLTGPECTGKTTLAAQLAAHFAAPWVPEAARCFAETAAVPLSERTVEPIARLAMRLEDDVIASAPTMIVRDTDLLSTVVYARHYYGTCPDWIADEAQVRRGDLYLLCSPDLPWAADGVRDRPSDRAALFDDFARTLEEFGARVEVVRGRDSARLRVALEAIDATLPSLRSRSPAAPRRT